MCFINLHLNYLWQQISEVNAYRLCTATLVSQKAIFSDLESQRHSSPYWNHKGPFTLQWALGVPIGRIINFSCLDTKSFGGSSFVPKCESPSFSQPLFSQRQIKLMLLHLMMLEWFNIFVFTCMTDTLVWHFYGNLAWKK